MVDWRERVRRSGLRREEPEEEAEEEEMEERKEEAEEAVRR